MSYLVETPKTGGLWYKMLISHDTYLFINWSLWEINFVEILLDLDCSSAESDEIAHPINLHNQYFKTVSWNCKRSVINSTNIMFCHTQKKMI